MSKYKTVYMVYDTLVTRTAGRSYAYDFEMAARYHVSMKRNEPFSLVDSYYEKVTYELEEDSHRTDSCEDDDDMINAMEDKIDSILYSMANFYTRRGAEGYKLDGSDYSMFEEAKQEIYLAFLEEVKEHGIDALLRIKRKLEESE